MNAAHAAKSPIAVVYLRRSRVQAGDTSLSLDVQERACRDWCARNGYDVAEVIPDTNVSGGKMTRPGFNRLVANLGAYDAIVSAKLDRIARSVSGLSDLVGQCDAAGVRVATADGRIDYKPGDPYSKMMVTVLGAVAELELALITERLRSGKAASAEAGRWAGGVVPFGLRTKWSDDLGGNVLVVNETEAAIIKHAISRRAAGASWNEVVRYFAANAETRRGGKWTRTNVQNVLGNKQLHDFGVLDTREWLLAQQVAGAKPATTGKPADRLTHGHSTTASRLLSGVAVCGGCGSKLRVQRDNRWADAASYVCKNPACSNKASISAKQLDTFVSEAWLDSNANRTETRIVAQYDLHAEQRAQLDAAIKAERAQLANLAAADMLAAVQRIAGLEADLAKLADAPRGAFQYVNTGRTMGQAYIEDGLDAQRRLIKQALGDDVLTVRPGRGPIDERVKPSPLFDPHEDAELEHRYAADHASASASS